MYTKKTQSFHFTTVKSQGKSVADGCLHQCTHMRAHTLTHSTNTASSMHIVCVRTPTHTSFKTLPREEKVSFRFS